jgi:hypothetical protein
VYGFWINDPLPGGIGSNTYVTIDKLTSDYYFPLNVPGDRYNGQFVAVTDPPNLDVELPEISDKEIEFAELPSGFTDDEARVVKRARIDESARVFADTYVINAAFEGAMEVLRYGHLADMFINAQVSGKPVYGKNECAVEFINNQVSFMVTIGIYEGELRLIQII